MTMAPLGDADKAAVQAFLASKRGRHQLYDNVQEKLLAYVAARGITLAELLPSYLPLVRQTLQRSVPPLLRDPPPNPGRGSHLVVAWMDPTV